MVIDSSAIIAILNNEPEASKFIEIIINNSPRRISAASLLEAAMVIESRYGQAGGQKLDELVQQAMMVIEPVTADQIEIARQCFRVYGKGRHAAGLNFGDCFAYALAKQLAEPLLFKGNDFSQTDITSAID